MIYVATFATAIKRLSKYVRCKMHRKFDFLIYVNKWATAEVKVTCLLVSNWLNDGLHPVGTGTLNKPLKNVIS